ncbi:MAG: NAD(P)-binding oxidoreductase [Pseudomonadota bacterium]
MANILVIGASRGIGLEATKQLLSEGHGVRAFARTASSSITLEHPRLEKFDADALDEGALQSAIRGSDGVIQSLGIPFDLNMIAGPISIFSRATETLVAAMQKERVDRLLCVTGFGSGDCHPHIHWLQKPAFNLVFGRAYADKSRQEAIIKDSHLDWTIVRPGMLTNGGMREDYKVLREPADWVNGSISRESVAHFLCQQATSEAFTHTSPVLVQHAWF